MQLKEADQKLESFGEKEMTTEIIAIYAATGALLKPIEYEKNYRVSGNPY